MRLVIQRVSHASVEIEGQIVASIQRGLLLLVAIAPEDSDEHCHWVIEKILNLRIFDDHASGFMSQSLVDIQGELMVVSQFTLYGNLRKGKRPSFSHAAPPSLAEPIYNRFVELLKARWPKVQTGSFGADMRVTLVNDGPVSLILDYPQ